MREFCSMVRLHLQKTFVKFPSEFKLLKLGRDFEASHNIPYGVSIIDGFYYTNLSTGN